MRNTSFLARKFVFFLREIPGISCQNCDLWYKKPGISRNTRLHVPIQRTGFSVSHYIWSQCRKARPTLSIKSSFHEAITCSTSLANLCISVLHVSQFIVSGHLSSWIQHLNHFLRLLSIIRTRNCLPFGSTWVHPPI